MSKKFDLGPVSAYAIAVKHGFTGTEEEWVESLYAKNSGYCGIVSTLAALPESGNEKGDTYYVRSEMCRVSWTGSEWVQSSMSELDYSNELAKIREKVETVTEPYGKNLFNMAELLKISGWSVSDGDYYGPLRYAERDIGAGGLTIAGGLKENTQYTVSLQGYNATESTSTSNGLRVSIVYTDGGFTTKTLSLNTNSWKMLTVSSDPERTVKGIILAYSNGPGNIWHIKEMQIEEGAEATAYEPPDLTAIDKRVRDRLGAFTEVEGAVTAMAVRLKELEAVTEPFGNNLFDTAFFQTAGWTADGNGGYTGTAAQLSRASYIPINGGWKTGTRYTLSFKVQRDATTPSGSEQTGQLRIVVAYDDSTEDKVTFPRAGVSGEDAYSMTTAAGKSVRAVWFVAPSKGSNTWHIREMQIEEGEEATDYEAAGLTAIDVVARKQKSGSDLVLNAITEETSRNLFDMESLVKAGWTKVEDPVNGDDYSGTTAQLSTKFNGIMPITGEYKAGVQYTVSMEAYVVDRGFSNKGLRVTFYYTNGDFDSLNYLNRNTTSWTSFTATSTAGKDVDRIILAAFNGAGDTWHIRKMQIEEGSTATAYDPGGMTAVDRVARQSTGQLSPSGGDDTDRIRAKLSGGECFLGPGEFHVNGLDMPNNSLLRGSGRKTVVRFDTGTKNYAIRIGQSCTIRDLKLVEQDISAEANRPGSDYTSGNTGIYATMISDEKPIRGVIAGVEISGFSHAGIKCWETGVNYEQSISISDCSIHHNNIGIFFDIHGEYNRVTGCAVNCNYYGVIANGGNNQFSACGFNGNAIGVLIDGKNFDSTNMAHGSFNGCSFNHSFSRDEQDKIVSNSGIAIKLLGVSSPEIFNGGGFGSGTLWLEDSGGAIFQGLYIGARSAIKIVDNDNDTRMHLFANCLVYGTKDGVTYPTVEVGSNSQVQFVNCYTRSGTAFTPTGS